MSKSIDPQTQARRNWCPPSALEDPVPPKEPQVVIFGNTEEELRASDPKCIKNPALTIPQIQAIIDVAFVAFGGRYAAYFVHALWCGERVTETLRTIAAAFDWEDLLLRVPGSVAKPHKERESEVFMNAFLMIAALHSAGLYTTDNLRPSEKRRQQIYVLAGFKTNNADLQYYAECERKKLKARGIELPRYDWGKSYPRNALRRTGLSMHYKLFLNDKVTTGWGGNSPDIFKEYYKRLVTRDEARQFWLMLPSILRAAGLTAKLPANHKLDTLLTKTVRNAVAKAESAMRTFREQHTDDKSNSRRNHTRKV